MKISETDQQQFLPRLENKNRESIHNNSLTHHLSVIRQSQSNIMALEELYENTNENARKSSAQFSFIQLPLSLQSSATLDLLLPKKISKNQLKLKNHLYPPQQPVIKQKFLSSHTSNLNNLNGNKTQTTQDQISMRGSYNLNTSQDNTPSSKKIEGFYFPLAKQKGDRSMVNLLLTPSNRDQKMIERHLNSSSQKKHESLSTQNFNEKINMIQIPDSSKSNDLKKLSLQKDLSQNANSSQFEPYFTKEKLSFGQPKKSNDRGVHSLYTKGTQLKNSSHNDESHKFKKIQSTGARFHSLEEEMFVRENWNIVQKYELLNGEAISFLFNTLSKNISNLLSFKSESHCFKVLEKFVIYNKRLKKLVDLENTPFKEFTYSYFLTKYLSILYRQQKEIQRHQESQEKGKEMQRALKSRNINLKSHHKLTMSQEESKMSSLYFHEMSDRIQQGDKQISQRERAHFDSEQSKTDIQSIDKIKDEEIFIQIQSSGTLPISKEEFLTHVPLVHDKQLLENIKDLNAKIEGWILSVQRNQIALFQEELIEITEHVFDKEVTFKQQLMRNQKKQGYFELNNLVHNKYSLNLHAMKSNLVGQIRECEEKNGDMKFISKQNTYKSENIDKVISALEKLDL